jgi:DNA repair/transcription protein MET18/MMS19
VQQLGEYINDEDPILRGKAVSFLTSVIKSLPPKYLSRQQIQVLTTFFCDRIEDGGAIAGLDTLQRLDRFTKDLVVNTAHAYVLSSFDSCIHIGNAWQREQY